MSFIKRYFFYSLMCSSVCLFSMDIRVETEVEKVHNRIDSELLKVNKNMCCKWLFGTLLSVNTIRFLSDEQKIKELDTIEGYITSEDKEAVLTKLERKHLYVSSLLDNLVDIKFREIQNVTGFTVDILLNPPTENGVKRLVHKRALEKYFDVAGINKLMAHVFLNKELDIHCTDLCEHKSPIQQDLLAMSADGKYLLSTDNAGKEKVWDIQQAEKINLERSQRQAIQFNFGKWQKSTSLFGYYSSFHDAVDKDDQYYATEGKPFGEYFPVLLWKRPTKKSYLCHRALLNSSNKPGELHALRCSHSFAAIEGFPKTNLEKKINSILPKEPAK